MNNTVNDFNSIFDQIAGIKLPQREKTIFSIRDRSHHENPLSDVLAFFIDPRKEHGLGSLFFDALLSCIHDKNIDSSTIKDIHREFSLENSRFDIIIEGDSWIFALELKVFSGLNNNLDAYTKQIEGYFKDKKYIYAILAPKRFHLRNQKWKSIEYISLLDALNKRYSELNITKPFTKWDVAFRDYMIHINQLTKGISMNIQDMEKIRKIHGKILLANKSAEEFRKNIFDLCVEEMKKKIEDDTEIEGSWHERWNSASVIRLKPNIWGRSNPRAMFALVICDEDGSFKIVSYIPKKHIDENLFKAMTEIGFIKNGADNDKNYWYFEQESKTPNITELIEKIPLIFKSMNSFSHLFLSSDHKE